MDQDPEKRQVSPRLASPHIYMQIHRESINNPYTQPILNYEAFSSLINGSNTCGSPEVPGSSPGGVWISMAGHPWNV